MKKQNLKKKTIFFVDAQKTIDKTTSVEIPTEYITINYFEKLLQLVDPNSLSKKIEGNRIYPTNTTATTVMESPKVISMSIPLYDGSNRLFYRINNVNKYYFWTKKKDAEDNVYYYNTISGESTWNSPFCHDCNLRGWTETFDDSQKTYYYTQGDKTQWEIPIYQLKPNSQAA